MPTDLTEGYNLRGIVFDHVGDAQAETLGSGRANSCSYRNALVRTQDGLRLGSVVQGKA
jgi:hypothetical protein